jgi:hypothetical protein
MSSYWSRVTRRLGALRQLRSLADALLFFQIFFFATAVPALLRLKLSRLQSLLELNGARFSPDPARVQKISNYVDFVLWVGRPLVRRGCLTRGLTLYYFLRRAGLDVTISFGMGKINGEFAGHCWLVNDSKPFLEAKSPQPYFAEIFRIPR